MGRHDSSDYSSTTCTSGTTINAIREVYSSDEPRRHKKNCCEPQSECTSANSCYGSGTSRYDPGVTYFMSMITPVNHLHPVYSGATGAVEFRMRRKNKTVTLQWEPFSGSMAQSGVSNLAVTQTIYNTPPYSIYVPIAISYKGVTRQGLLNIEPTGYPINIRFFLNLDTSATGINSGDAFTVFGGAVTWIVD